MQGYSRSRSFRLRGLRIGSTSTKAWFMTLPAPCPSDLNHDNQIDDSDFVVFATAYNSLDCSDPAMPSACPADLNRDAFVNDSDFVLFVGAYNGLLCP